MTERKSKYERAAIAINEQRDARVQELAERLREELVLPKCRKRGLTFLSGNGDYFFLDPSGARIGTGDDAQIKRYGLRRIFDILDTEIGYNEHLGFWVGAV